MTYPVLAEGNPLGNVYGEHVYEVRATFDGSDNVAFRSLSARMDKLGAGQWKLTLPMPYKEVTAFECGWTRAHGQVPLVMQIVTNDVAVDGTLTVEALDPTGAATSPQNGDVAFIRCAVSQDTQNDKYTGTG